MNTPYWTWPRDRILADYRSASPFSVRRCTSASARAVKPTSPTKCCPTCITSLAAMRKRLRPRKKVIDAHVSFGCAGALRRDRRSRPQDDLPGALRDGETRCTEGPGDRRRLLEMESGASAPPRDGQHQAIRRDR